MTAAGETRDLLEHLVFEIARGVAGATGDGFLRSLAHHLSRALDADHVLIGALLPGEERIATLAACVNGADAPSVEYDLAGTPCAGVVEKRVCSYPQGIQALFPRDHLLAEMGAEGYVGSPIIDSRGQCLGLIRALT